MSVANAPTVPREGVEAADPIYLDFRLPPFTRFTWVSEDARSLWLPRLQRLQRMLDSLAVHVAADGVVACATRPVKPGDVRELTARAEDAGLVLDILDEGKMPGQAAAMGSRARRIRRTVVIGTSTSVGRYVEAHAEGDEETLANLSGQPICCLGGARGADPIWQMANASAFATPVDSVLPSGAREFRLNIPANPACNPLLGIFDLQITPHRPCSFDCAYSIALADDIVHCGRRSGLGEDIEMLISVLSWPMEWSALNGIAEIRTPILKAATDTVATGDRIVVAYEGTEMPELAARGRSFPYLLPKSGRPRNLRQLNRSFGRFS